MLVDLNEIGQIEVDLEKWLVEQATFGVPELALASLLRNYADDVEDLGYVLRIWGSNKQ